MKMNIVRKNRFLKSAKKLHANQRSDLEKALDAITGNPAIGVSKTANLTGILVYKFRMANQQVLLAYTYDELSDTLTLRSLGSHQNFYRDMKNR